MSIPRLPFCHIYWLAHSSADLYSTVARSLHWSTVTPLVPHMPLQLKTPQVDFKISLWVYSDKFIQYCGIVGISTVAPAQFHPQNCSWAVHGQKHTWAKHRTKQKNKQNKKQNKSFLSISFPPVFPPSKMSWVSSYNTEILQGELSYWRILFHRAIQSVTQFCIKLH